MSNISDYIKSNKKLKSLDFLTVYLKINLYFCHSARGGFLLPKIFIKFYKKV